ncbi:hypothetical protein [Brachybacterium sp. YJGR34]|uniref:hypothetical protein n=1 Tax=Brachybacterium sp. YJGR34 TaxID=2059911 RepID=UPI000E0A39EE|nr:hypothetical protein [Brachybacterium sp. YJGR34]
MSIATAAPALAVSACSVDLPPASEENGWVAVFDPEDGIDPSRGVAEFANGGYALTMNPVSGLTDVTVTASSPPTEFIAGNTYTFTFDFVAFGQNARDLSFDLRVDGEALPGSHIDTGTTNSSGSLTAVYTPTTSGMKTVELYFFFDPTSTSAQGDDITITDLAVTCV